MDYFHFSKTVHTIRTNFSTLILHNIRVLYVPWHQTRMTGDSSESEGKRPKPTHLPPMRPSFEEAFSQHTVLETKTYNYLIGVSNVELVADWGFYN